MHRKLMSWIVFAISSTVFVALLICFASANPGVQMNLTQEKINEKYLVSNDEKGLEGVTGMASGGGSALKITAVILALIAVVGLLWVTAVTEKSKSVACFMTATTCTYGYLICSLPCWLLLIIAIMLFMMASMVGKKASDAASGQSSSSKSSADLSSDLNKQATQNQRTEPQANPYPNGYDPATTNPYG
jgi:uncharacterized membrane protein